MDSSVLRSVPIFTEFDDDQLVELAARYTVRAYPKGSVVVREGDRGGSLHVILAGSVAVVRTNGDGRETILSILKHREFFGEMSLFDEAARSATVRTVEFSRIASIERPDIVALIGASPEIGRSLIVALSRRLRDANELITAATLHDVPSRVATLLLRLMQGFGQPVTGGTKIGLKLTNLEMANMVGSTRESVNRALNRFWDEHLIDMRSSHIVVVEPEKLRALIP
ncbi:MAG: Crp/Fnr family transcriptional regulator [Vulcanimicrobiaceae bacterium]